MPLHEMSDIAGFKLARNTAPAEPLTADAAMEASSMASSPCLSITIRVACPNSRKPLSLLVKHFAHPYQSIYSSSFHHPQLWAHLYWELQWRLISQTNGTYQPPWCLRVLWRETASNNQFWFTNTTILSSIRGRKWNDVCIDIAEVSSRYL